MGLSLDIQQHKYQEAITSVFTAIGKHGLIEGFGVLRRIAPSDDRGLAKKGTETP